MLAFLRDPRVTLAPMPVNGEPGILVYRDGRLFAVIALEVRDGLVTHLHGIANPHKLAYVSSVLDAISEEVGSRSVPATPPVA